MSEAVIELSGVSKRYEIQRRATPRMGAWFLSKLFEHLQREPFLALEDVSFQVRAGEMVGIVGDNGAGKSTILKLIAGITEPTTGSVRVQGRVASLLELGVGFHPDLTGLENIFYNGALMGLSRRQVHERLDAIIEFSGLREHLYDEVRQYSTGMYARLACSVAMHLDPDIVLVDEILAVGDAEFQQRGMLRLLDMHRAGVTMVLVTHELTAAQALCDRLIWLEAGRVRADGPAAAIHRDYVAATARRTLPGLHPLHPDRALAPGVEAGSVDLVVPPDGLARRGGAFEVTLSGRARPGERLAALIAVRWEDDRLLFEERSEPAVVGADGGFSFHYRVDRWPLGGFRGSMQVAVLDAAGAPCWRSDRVNLVSEAEGIYQPHFLVLPETRVESLARDGSG